MRNRSQPSIESFLNQKQSNLYAVIVSIVIALSASALYVHFMMLDFDPLHHTIMFKMGLDLYEGMIPFVETSCFYGILQPLILAAGIAVFGKYLLVFYIFGGIVMAGILITTFFIWRTFMPAWLAVVCQLLYSVLMIPSVFSWSNHYATLFMLFSLLSLLIYMKKRNNILLIFYSGLFTGISFLARHQIGIAYFILFIFLLLWLMWREVIQKKNIMKTLGIYILGFIIPVSFYITYIVLTDGFDEWLVQSFGYMKGMINSMAGHYSDTASAASSMDNFIANVVFVIYTWTSNFRKYFILYFALFYSGPAFLIVILLMKKLKNINLPASFDTMSVIGWFVFFGFFPQAIPIFVGWRFFLATGLGIGVSIYVFYIIAKKITHNNKISLMLALLIWIIPAIPFFRWSVAAYETRLSRNDNEYITCSSVPVMSGIRCKPNEAYNYECTYSIIKSARNINPSIPVISAICETTSILFVENNKNAHPFFFQERPYKNCSLGHPLSLGKTNTVDLFPNYWRIVDRFIKKEKPLIITVNRNYPEYTAIRLKKINRQWTSFLKSEEVYYTVLVPDYLMEDHQFFTTVKSLGDIID